MNTQKGFAPILLILLGLIVIGGGIYFYRQNNLKDITEDTQAFVIGGIWKFEEFSKKPNLDGVTYPSWEYTLSIDTEDDTKGILHIDGYQTMTRLNVKVQKLNDSANIIFDSYAEGNQFETYKQGDVLITVSPDSDRNLMSIYWYKMQPNIEKSKTGAIFVRQEEIINKESESKKEIVSGENLIKKIIFKNADYSFTYNSEDSCIKVNDEYLNKEESKKYRQCFSSSISAPILGTPDKVIDYLIYPGGPDSDGIWGKACFNDEKRITPNGYTVRYFEDPDINKLWGSPNCGTHPTKQANESVGNMNIYFIVDLESNKYVRIDDVNNSTSTTRIWELINSFKFN